MKEEKTEERLKRMITIRELDEKQNVLDELSNKDYDSGVLTHRITVLVQFFMSNLKTYSKAVEKLRRRYGYVNDKGDWKIKPESILKFNDEVDKMLDEEMEIDILKLDFGDIKLNPKQRAIMWDFLDSKYIERSMKDDNARD